MSGRSFLFSLSIVLWAATALAQNEAQKPTPVSAQAWKSLLEQLKDPSPQVRTQAARSLGQLGDKRSVPHLIEALRDKDDYVQETVANALGALQDPKSLKRIEALLKDPDYRVRVGAINALVSMKPEGVVSTLLAIERSPAPGLKDPRFIVTVRYYAIEGLGRLKAAQSAPRLRELLEDEDRLIRQAAALAIEDMRDEEGLRRLATMSHHEDEFWRRQAIDAIVTLKASEHVPALIECLNDPSEMNSRCAAQGILKVLGNEKGYQVLLELARSDDKEKRDLAWKAFGEIQDPSLIPVMVELLGDAKGWNRGLAARRLPDLNPDEPTRKKVLDLLQDPDPWVQQTASESLARMGVSQPADFVSQLAESPNQRTRMLAVRSLANSGDKNSLPEIAKFGKDPSIMVRVEVARALAVFRSQESLPELRELLDDPVGEVRAQALLSLVDLEDRSSLPQIRSMVTDDCPEVRAGVAKAIGQLKDTESVPLLLDLVSNGSKVAIAAADSLKIMQVREAIPTLIPLLSHRVPEVRAKALEVLGDFGAVEAEPKIRELLQDPDERVRQAAQSAILAFPSKDTEEKILAELQKPTTQENLRLAIKSVVKMRGAEAIPLLISVSRPDADEALAEALKSLGVERSVKDLIQRVVSSDPDKRDQMTRDASRILKILGVKEIWPSLRTAVLSGDSETASGVGVLLSDMAQDWQIGEQIRNVFPDPDPRVSVLLAEALSDAGRRDMSGSLLELMKDPNPDISLRAAVCLGASGQNPVPIKVDILIIQALQDQDPGRRTRAAKAAGHARVYRSSDRLMEMAEKDPDSSVRSSAAKALEMLVSR